MTQNPLLAPVSDLVDYAAVKPGHIVPAIEELLGIARQAVDHAADAGLAPTWEAVVEPLDTASERLWRAWSVAGHLNAVVNTPELREAYNAALPLITDAWPPPPSSRRGRRCAAASSRWRCATSA
ncbi:hypothetical protein G6F24_014332 [Rhizopus arrhizus]|nr:hypothetical protein G6F24_014332 [Rhizopus arrhizus]